MNVFDRGDAMGKKNSFDNVLDIPTRKCWEIKCNIMHSGPVSRTINFGKDAFLSLILVE